MNLTLAPVEQKAGVLRLVMTIAAAVLLSGCASMHIPKDDVYNGHLIEMSRGVFFVPCNTPKQEYWQPNFIGAANEDLNSIQRRGVTRTPQGAFVKVYGTSSPYVARVGEVVISQILQVSKITLDPGGACQ